jgi:hypothetical protein
MLAKILVISPIPHDPVSSWRALGPLTALKDKFEIVYIPEGVTPNWVDISLHDLIFMHRPFTPKHLETMILVKEMNKPIVLDLDDDLSCVTPDNPVAGTYNQPAIQESYRKCLQLADHTMVTTNHLAEQLRPFSKNISVVPNAWDERFIPIYEKNKIYKNVLWRGSTSHVADLMSHLAPIKENAAQHDDWRWHIYGDRPWFLQEALPAATFHGGRSWYSYHKNLGLLRPDLIFVPLKDNKFNKSKSNIAWLEGTMAGAAALVPDWEAWSVPGATRYKDVDDFQEKLDMLLTSPKQLLKLRNESLEYIKTNLNLTIVNKQREEIFRSLIK